MGTRTSACAATLCLAAVAVTQPGCSKKPESGKYCAVSRPSECMYIDLDHDVVTFYDRLGPMDVAASYSSGFIDAQPKVGKYAGKRVRLGFDLADPRRFTLEAEAVGTGAADERVEFARK